MASAAFHSSSIESITGRLFDRPIRFKGPKPGGRGKSAGKGGSRSGLSKAQQLARAALRRPSAVAKLISRGGTRDRKGLKGQLEYVFTKADAVIDSQGAYGDQTTLSNVDMNRITRTWEGSWNSRTQTGNTSHVLLSYPIGTPLDKVTAITADVCNELLLSGDKTFEFVAGVHTDRDHPHAHIIINRFPVEGGPLFMFRKDTDISFEAFKEAMVAHGERYGVLMQSTSRFERGIVERSSTTKEVYEARDEGRAPKPRAYNEAYDRYAKAQVNDAADLYAALAVMVDNEGFQPVVDACDLASEALRTGFSITTGDIDMDVQTTDVEALDNALATLGNNLDQFRDAIETAEPALRPAYDKEYARILAVASSYAPDSVEAKLFKNDATEPTPYSSLLPYNANGLAKPELKDMVDKSLGNSGIDRDEVLARVSLGAENEFLETQWIIRDLQTLARTQDIDLSDNLAEAQHQLESIYGELRCDFVEIGALREEPEVHAVETDSASIFGHSTPLGVSKLLDHHRSGKRGLPADTRSQGAEAVKAALSADEYRELLSGKSEVLERFTDNPTERLFLATQVLQQEVDNGRTDLRREATLMRNAFKRENVSGHDNDHGL